MTTPAKITAEIQKLSPSAKIELFVLDLTPFGDDIYRFHAGTNGLTQNVVWQGNTYVAYPVEASGFDFNGNGQLPRPVLRVGNVLGSISALVMVYNDILGAKVTRKRTFAKYLDAVNFPGGVNVDADSSAEFSEDIYYIDRKAEENPLAVEFELASIYDVQGIKLPRRQIVQNLCTWIYKSSECGYTGTNYFDGNDQPVGSVGLDVCGKRLSSCKCRFGAYAQLPFGGFPGVGLLK